MQSIWRIPYFEPDIGDEEKRLVLEALERGWLAMGPNVAAFERAFASELGDAPSVEAVALSNCTAALHLAIVALGIGPGDEVICPSLTFVADANAIRYAGATPVFADVRSANDLTIDPSDVARKVTSKTRAVIAVHYAGYPCDLDALEEIGRGRDIALIEDACHGPLATDARGRPLGTVGDVGCFSFYSNKNMTTAEGGMLVSARRDVCDAARRLRSHGMTSTTADRYRTHAFGYDVTTVGFNYRMDELRAAVGLAQLRRLRAWNVRRRELARRYRRLLTRLHGLEVPFSGVDGDMGGHIMSVLLPESAKSRGEVMNIMAELGVQTSFHYTPIHHFSAYRGASEALPVTEALAARLLSLPLYPKMADSAVEDVVSALEEALSR